MSTKRCKWADGQFPEYIEYHDQEWGVPVYDDRIHFEFLILESAQAGLSWSTILKRREGYRNAFAGFDPTKVAQFDENHVQKLMENQDIVRHELKIRSAISNARHFIEIQKEFGSFNKYVWHFVGGERIVNNRETIEQIPSNTTESDALSKDLKKRGFKFVGSTIMYAYMQACGLVMDHTMDCFRFAELANIE
ncbi:DNA-3-methyladenine glycosylase I [Gracilimonas sp. Q87]|uniref:DNA-3-methyladenine glycosylase I n=1 Tax=Gracilimonas sp. Q87 TaxID=3384766 RepID=UPI003983E4A1